MSKNMYKKLSEGRRKKELLKMFGKLMFKRRVHWFNSEDGPIQLFLNCKKCTNDIGPPSERTPITNGDDPYFKGMAPIEYQWNQTGFVDKDTLMVFCHRHNEPIITFDTSYKQKKIWDHFMNPEHHRDELETHGGEE